MDDKINANRFTGFAGLYETVRPTVPAAACEILLDYVGKKPHTVIDLGCGTGLSTGIWKGKSERIIGIDPSEDMLETAKKKETKQISFLKAFSNHTALPDESADIVVCSQSFHWMEPYSTLMEVNRILKPNGVFAAIDCDWPPVCDWRAEKEYNEFRAAAQKIEKEHADTRENYQRWDKKEHLAHIKNSGYFRYSREIVLFNREKANAERFIGIALSQSGVQAVLKTYPARMGEKLEVFEKRVREIFGDREFYIGFCYRMRIGIK